MYEIKNKLITIFCFSCKTLIALVFSRFWMLPSLLLKKMVMGNFTAEHADPRIIESVDFMVERVSIYL